MKSKVKTQNINPNQNLIKTDTAKPIVQLRLRLHETSTLKELFKQENPHLYTFVPCYHNPNVYHSFCKATQIR